MATLSDAASVSPKETLNKAILAFSPGGQKASFLPAFTSIAHADENGGASMCGGKHRLHQRFLADTSVLLHSWTL
jgi:hypothetical protein